MGPSRPWLIGFYANTYIKVFGVNGLPFIERMLIGFEEEMKEGCLGTLSELYDCNPPFIGRGAVSYAANIAGVVRIVRIFKNLKLVDY